jgi:cytidylate kinase
VGWNFLDSGALYRLTGLAARQRGIPLDDEGRLEPVAAQLDVRFIPQPGGTPKIILDGQEVTDLIRTEQAGGDASRVAALPSVRRALLQRQRDFRRPPGLVADGRDMGTTVFPDAPVKIFLTASVEARGERRYKQLKEKGLDVNLAALLGEIAERDERDRSRSASPLVPAADAIIIDTSDLGIQAVFDEVMAIVEQRLSMRS